MKITKEQIKKMSSAFHKAPTQQVIQKSVTRNGILESTEDIDVAKNLSPDNFAFSIDVDKEAVANQKMSGRCWMFACLNTLRFHIEKELDLPKGTFELSQAYLAFYNKLERAAWFLDHAVKTADKSMDDREVTWLFQTPMADGGDWDMICGLIKKYGVMPHQAMAETHCTNDTAEVNTVLSHLLRQYGLELRGLAQKNKETKPRIDEMLTDVYRILAVAFGEPPEKFTFQYADSKGKYHILQDVTPLDFYKKYLPINLDNYIGVVNVPGKDRPFDQMYAIEDSDQIPERENLYLNLEMSELKELVIKQLKAGLPVWFGCDVLQHCDREKGVMSKKLFDIENAFGIKFNMDKEQRYDTRESLPTHAMVIAGVDIVDGKPTKWKIENSWGTENGGKKTGNNGYFVCDDEWFDNFVYEVAIDKQFMTAKQKKALKTTPIVWPFWVTFNPVASSLNQMD